MIAEAVYPIIESLSREEQLKLFQKLEKDLQTMKISTTPRPMTAKQKYKADCMKWLKQNVFYPPK